ncbi:O-antigen ligase [Geoalkalibacter ferrihydriticus]|uniref:O-antigen ligase n=1 Tax=Geoalkalibacter ferrihydriticus TaxID=392333 RepID=A0A1G9WJ75_9BACT|nr:O-antigen ligase family protein [Geoalkalibacter ferrihydriticus]SDM84594.1 O-antigen ligase [Geoalkalibacter ferrihydriticus]
MLPLKTILYLTLFCLALVVSVFQNPIVGIYGYLATYNVNPLGQWWGRFLPGWAARYSFWLALAIAMGIAFNYSKLRFKRFFETQELLLILFVGVIWASVFLGQGSGIDYNVMKMTKVAIVLLMASHIITTRRYFQGMIWVFVLSGLYLGYELYSGSGAYRGGRFHAGVGGSDFGEGNFLAAHFGILLPFIGVMLIKGNWKVRVVCVLAAAFVANAIVITQSRGIFVGLAAGLLAAVFFTMRLKGYRKKVLALIFIGLLGVVYVADDNFWNRMRTIQIEEDGVRDRSAEGRVEAWHAALAMARDYPLGVGVGQFFGHAGVYVPEAAGRDTHNTYLRCLAELGFHGLLVLILMIFTSFLMCRRIEIESAKLAPEIGRFFLLNAYAIKLALVVYLVTAMFISSVYIEEMYWLLMMPVFLKRAMENEVEDNRTEEKIRQIVGDA